MKKHSVYNAIDRPHLWRPALQGKRVGLITNPSGVDRELNLTSDLLYREGLLTCLFSPEHGVRGDLQAGETVDTYTDSRTGLPVYSLYGRGKRHISADVLQNLDAVAFDIQDVGARFYTYIYTLSFAMEDCAAAGKEMIVFDRLNPLGGRMEGTLLEPAFASTIGRYPIPTRFGLTVGEFARYINDVHGIGCRLTVLPIEGWQRSLLFDDTDLSWVPPSPNLPTTHANLCYIGTCIAEGTNLSEGRGTTKPFETVGAPWLDAERLAEEMNALSLSGVRFRPCGFVPTFSKHQGELCRGVQLHITDPHAFRPFETGLRTLDRIRRNHKEFSFRAPSAAGTCFPDLLMGCDDLRRESFEIEEFLSRHHAAIQAFSQDVKPYLLYSEPKGDLS